jgi:YVTN family beta-propeller protein
VLRRAVALTACLFAVCVPVASARPLGGTPVALVTAEQQNELLAVSLPDGHVLRRVKVAADPETIAAQPNGPAIVVSPRSHTITVLAWHSLRTLAVLRDFRSPQIAAITPDGNWAYITDAGTGDLTVLDLKTQRIVDRLHVGANAHHLTISPDQSRTWVALGETASTIVILNTTTANHPRVLGSFHPPTPVHDLVFAPDGRSVWVSSSHDADVLVLDARNQKVIATVPAGAAPQHIAFGARNHVYITSGYASSIETIDATTHRALRHATAPYGSFNLATAGDLVATSSLLNGTLTEYNGANLHKLYSAHLASATRDLALSVW